MTRPLHIALMFLGRSLTEVGLTDPVTVQLSSDDFDRVLALLDSGPGRANKPTNVTDTSFEFDDVLVQKVT